MLNERKKPFYENGTRKNLPLGNVEYNPKRLSRMLTSLESRYQCLVVKVCSRRNSG